MRINVLFGQRHERFAGGRGPEALAVIDEISNDENPEYMEEEYKKYKADTSFAALAVVTISVPSAAIHAALFPSIGEIEGQVETPGC